MQRFRTGFEILQKWGVGVNDIGLIVEKKLMILHHAFLLLWKFCNLFPC
jgi:hypothetical protein